MERAAPDTEGPQRVHGQLLGWNPGRATVSFKSYLSDQTEDIAVKSIGLQIYDARGIAQRPLPQFVPLGSISTSFPAKDVTIRDRVVMLPGCSAQHKGHPVLFAGKVTFSTTTVVIEGTVVELKPPPPSHSSNTTTSKGGG